MALKIQSVNLISQIAMSTSTAMGRKLDLAGIVLSIGCLVHCLAIPLLAVAAIGWAGSSEVLHAGILAVAVPVGSVAALRVQNDDARNWRRWLLLAGVVLLIAGFSIESLGSKGVSIALTMAGGLALVVGHSAGIAGKGRESAEWRNKDQGSLI